MTDITNGFKKRLLARNDAPLGTWLMAAAPADRRGHGPLRL